jgi:hypothetical protein
MIDLSKVGEADDDISGLEALLVLVLEVVVEVVLEEVELEECVGGVVDTCHCEVIEGID